MDSGSNTPKSIDEYISWAKGTVRFPPGKPLPYDLIREIVRFRAAENQAKAAGIAK